MENKNLETILEKIYTYYNENKDKFDSNVVKTNLDEIDNSFVNNGLEKRAIYAIGGKVGSGKTALARHIAHTNAENNNVAAFFNLETSEREFYNCLLAKESKIALHKIKTNNLDDFEQNQLVLANKRLKSIKDNFIMKSFDNIKLSDLLKLIYDIKIKSGLDLAVINCLQHVLLEDGKVPCKEEDFAFVLDTLNLVSKSLNIAIIFDIQINNQCQSIEDITPSNEDIKNNEYLGNLNEIVAGLFLVSYNYNVNNIANLIKSNKMEITIAKNRFGNTGERTVIVDPTTGAFYNKKATKKVASIDIYVDENVDERAISVLDVISSAVENRYYINGDVRFELNDSSNNK